MIHSLLRRACKSAPRALVAGRLVHRGGLTEAIRMGNNNYRQASGYDDDWEDEEEVLSSPTGSASRWHGKVAGRHSTLCYVVAAAVLALAMLLLYRLRYKLFWGMWNVPIGLWSRKGVLTVGAKTPFFIKGVSWYGMELPSRCLEGLHVTGMNRVLDIVAANNFNAIRLPLALDSYMANQPIEARQISTFANPELTNLLYRDLLDRVVQSAAERNILVLLDLHRLEAANWPTDGLWYSRKIPEEIILNFWSSLAERYGDNRKYWNVVGADLFNEPHGAKKWEEWKSFVERASEVIARRAPHWLIVVEGVGNEAGGVKEPVFWAENLHPAYNDLPHVRHDPRKLVLSPHVYGPSVHNQSYFSASNFPHNMPEIWDDHFGGANRTGAAVIVGEVGGHNVGLDEVWHQEVMKYLSAKHFSFFYWCLNPGSQDTGGIMAHDWRNVNDAKLELLQNARSTPVATHKWLFQRG